MTEACSPSNDLDRASVADASAQPNSPPNPDRVIKSYIEAALRRRFDAAEQNIVVSVVARTVTLTGTVTGWWHRDRARDLARRAPGVVHLADRLAIGT